EGGGLRRKGDHGHLGRGRLLGCIVATAGGEHDGQGQWQEHEAACGLGHGGKLGLQKRKMRPPGSRRRERMNDHSLAVNNPERNPPRSPRSPFREPRRARTPCQSQANAMVVISAFSACRESSRVCWTTTGTSDSMMLANGVSFGISSGSRSSLNRRWEVRRDRKS